MFYFRTIIAEISSAEQAKINKTDCVSIKKVELNDVIVNVAEFDE
jgi:hypothetical protein